MTTRTITGIHHITAVAGDPQRNLDFYTKVLGLRLVKLTVNFDDPCTYHLYFGNDRGAPGSILTFFPWANVRKGVVGSGQVSATTFAVPAHSISYWGKRLSEFGVTVPPAVGRFGESVISFTDPDGLPLEIVGTASATPEAAWSGSSVDAQHAICGFNSATLSELGYEQTAHLLQHVMGFSFVGSEGNRFRYRCGGENAGTIVDILCTPDGQVGTFGGGTVHHIAWRTSDDAQQMAWRQDLARLGYDVSPVMDRTYFHSIYYREPGGVLFEIATDPPGFALDEPIERLGERLMLPSQYEPSRGRIEKALPKLVLPVSAVKATP